MVRMVAFGKFDKLVKFDVFDIWNTRTWTIWQVLLFDKLVLKNLKKFVNSRNSNSIKLTNSQMLSIRQDSNSQLSVIFKKKVCFHFKLQFQLLIPLVTPHLHVLLAPGFKSSTSLSSECHFYNKKMQRHCNYI